MDLLRSWPGKSFLLLLNLILDLKIKKGPEGVREGRARGTEKAVEELFSFLIMNNDYSISQMMPKPFKSLIADWSWSDDSHGGDQCHSNVLCRPAITKIYMKIQRLQMEEIMTTGTHDSHNE